MMKIVLINRIAYVILLSFLVSCAPQKVRGYQNVYERYNIPQGLVDRAAIKLHEHGLNGAAFARDSVGRLRLVGTYHNDEEVEEAFLIVQSIVGIKSTSPFYPENVLMKRWEQDAARTLLEYNQSKVSRSTPPAKRALVVGINHFLDSKHIPDIQGADDAQSVSEALSHAGYDVKKLLGADATKVNIEAALAKLSKEIGSDDTVFIYISSHGALPVPSSHGHDERNMSIVAYDTGEIPGSQKVADATEFALLVQKTAVKDTLVQQVAHRPSRITRVFIDTCYSGEMLRDMPADSRAYILRTNGGQEEQAGVSLTAWMDGQSASKGIRMLDTSSPEVSSPTTKAPHSPHRQGYTIITATSEGERAWGPDIKVGTFPSPIHPGLILRGSYFTQTFFDYLEEHHGNVQMSFHAASNFTQHQVASATKGVAHQVPRIFNTVPSQTNNFYQQ